MFETFKKIETQINKFEKTYKVKNFESWVYKFLPARTFDNLHLLLGYSKKNTATIKLRETSKLTVSDLQIFSFYFGKSCQSIVKDFGMKHFTIGDMEKLKAFDKEVTEYLTTPKEQTL